MAPPPTGALIKIGSCMHQASLAFIYIDLRMVKTHLRPLQHVFSNWCTPQPGLTSKTKSSFARLCGYTASGTCLRQQSLQAFPLPACNKIDEGLNGYRGQNQRKVALIPVLYRHPRLLGTLKSSSICGVGSPGPYASLFVPLLIVPEHFPFHIQDQSLNAGSTSNFQVFQRNNWGSLWCNF